MIEPTNLYYCFVDGGCPGNGVNAVNMFGSYVFYDVTKYAPEGVSNIEVLMQEPPILEVLKANLIYNSVKKTNNAAEALAFQMALNTAICKKLFISGRVVFHMDSQLTLNQLKGLFKIKNSGLKRIHKNIWDTIEAHNKKMPDGIKIQERMQLRWISGEDMKTKTILAH